MTTQLIEPTPMNPDITNGGLHTGTRCAFCAGPREERPSWMGPELDVVMIGNDHCLDCLYTEGHGDKGQRFIIPWERVPGWGKHFVRGAR